MLRVRDLQVRYGSIVAVRGASFDVAAGSVVALVGPNGSGKTSLLSAVAGLVEARGEIALAGERVELLPAERRAAGGLAFVPDGRRLFGRLTVEQNLLVGAVRMRGRRAARAAVERALARVPLLGARAGQRADTLSGGEGQLLMIGRALVTEPRVLLVDEPYEGLSAGSARVVADALRRAAEDGAAVAVASPDPVEDAVEMRMEHGRLMAVVP